MKKKILCAVMVMVMIMGLGICSTDAYAFSQPSSDWKTTSSAIKGYKYQYRSRLDFYNTSTPQKVAARGQVSVVEGHVPAGYIGIRSKLFRNGILMSGSSWAFNDDICSGLSTPTATTSKTGTYYSKCKFKFYNGNGYTGGYTAYKSPSISIKTINGGEQYPININDNGETYGSELSELYTGATPDLILAEGDDGVIGYVRDEDFENDIDTLDEALSYGVEDGEREEKKIPLYDKEGNVVGTFTVVTIGTDELI